MLIIVSPSWYRLRAFQTIDDSFLMFFTSLFFMSEAWFTLCNCIEWICSSSCQSSSIHSKPWEMRRLIITVESTLSCVYFVLMRWACPNADLHFISGSDLSVCFLCPCIIDGYYIQFPYPVQSQVWITDASRWCLLTLRAIPIVWSGGDVFMRCCFDVFLVGEWWSHWEPSVSDESLTRNFKCVVCNNLRVV